MNPDAFHVRVKIEHNNSFSLQRRNKFDDG